MMREQRLYGLGDVCRKLQVAPHKINWLFTRGDLNRDEFTMVSGKRLFTEAQVRQIARLLGEK